MRDQKGVDPFAIGVIESTLSQLTQQPEVAGQLLEKAAGRLAGYSGETQGGAQATQDAAAICVRSAQWWESWRQCHV